MATDPNTPEWAKTMPEGFYDLAKASQATAVTGAFDESRGVEGRVKRITATDNPLMASARTRSKQRMQRIGGLNTSLAGQAGEQAVIDSALSMATPDAQMYSSQALANQSAQNQAALQNAQIMAQVGTAGFNLGENRRQFEAGLSWDKDKFGTNLVEQKRQFDSRLGLDQAAQDTQREQFEKTHGLSREEFNQRDRQFGDELAFRQRDLDQRGAQFNTSEANRMSIAKMDDAEARQKIVELEGKWRNEIASNENISRAWGTMMENISQIQNNPDLDAEAKATRIGNVQAGFASFANFWKKVSGVAVDVSDLLNFGPTAGAGGNVGGEGSSGNSGGNVGSSTPAGGWSALPSYQNEGP